MASLSDLPRELRDQVYEQYILDVVTKQQPQEWGPLITTFPLLRVNKQVRCEAIGAATRVLLARVQNLGLKARRLQHRADLYDMLSRKAQPRDWYAYEVLTAVEQQETERVKIEAGWHNLWLREAGGGRNASCEEVDQLRLGEVNQLRLPVWLELRPPG